MAAKAKAKSKVTVSVQPANHRPTTAERRAAQVEMIAGKQAELKREAAERRAKRALLDAQGTEPVA
ncbi:MAG TPA: hypothetical protein VIJ20_14240 [Solirubrobacteraceae bacterium]